MRWLIGIAVAALVLRRIGAERIADAVRWADQRLELFSPRGAALYARFAVPLLEPLHRQVAAEVAAEVAALTSGTVLDVGTGPGELILEPKSTPRSLETRWVGGLPLHIAMRLRLPFQPRGVDLLRGDDQRLGNTSSRREWRTAGDG